MKKVAIVSTGHPPYDERIFNKIGKSLTKLGYKVYIVVTTQSINIDNENISIYGINIRDFQNKFTSKFNFILNNLKAINPDLIICCEPVPVIFAFMFTLIQKRKSPSKIIYDITEWYPENVYLKRKGISRFFLYFLGHLINFTATNLSDYLFVGEEEKLLRYRKYSPKKKYSIISYFPILDYYESSTQKFKGEKIVFGYAGVISVSRGLDIFYQVIKTLKEKTHLKIEFILAGKFELEAEKIYLDNFKSLKIDLKFFDWTDYINFSKSLEPTHICLDIRPPNKIYERSLPIKIFDYMALGKCIIASDYHPIRKVFEIANCGVLVDPLNFENIVDEILGLIKNPEKIYQYGINGRNAVEKFFNWSICEEELKRALSSLEL